MAATKAPFSPNPVTEFIKIDFATRSAQMRVFVASFIDSGHHVAYIPSLKLSGYATSKDDAIKMLFEDVVDDMFENLFELDESTITNELGKYGWHKAKGIPNKKFYNDRPFVSPTGILENFNLPQNTDIQVKMMEVGQVA